MQIKLTIFFTKKKVQQISGGYCRFKKTGEMFSLKSKLFTTLRLYIKAHFLGVLVLKRSNSFTTKMQN